MTTLPNNDYPTLLSPLELGPLTLDNRVVIPGHSMLLDEADGTVGPRYRSYLEERAKGGAGLVSMASAPVHASSKQAWPSTWLWRDEVVEGLKSAADAVHKAGSKLSIILWHGGHNLTHLVRVVAMGPSTIPSPESGEIPRMMTRADIDELTASYAAAAKRCSDAGLDAVEVQTSSDYLLGSFLSPQLNWRTDEYGGSLENRCRFAVQVLDSVRKAVRPGMAVGVRTCAEHLIPADPDGYTLADSLPAMRHLDEKELMDWVSIMNGSHWCFEEMLSPMTYPRAQIAHLSAAFKRTLKVPVIVAGRIRTPQEAESILSSGQADAVAMARAHIAEPEWTEKVKRGEAHRIRPCMSCNQGCLGHAGQGQPGTCVLNPRAGREFEAPTGGQARRKKRVAIVGGGPAGLEAARVAAARGHAVALYESRGVLGGAMRLAAEAPHRDEMKEPLMWWQSELETLGVDIRLNRHVRDPRSLDADAVLWAAGARGGLTALWRNRPNLTDGIPGTEDCPHGRDILAGDRGVKGHVLVIDEESGWPAVSLVESLADQSAVKAVTVTTTQFALGLPALERTGEIRAVSRRLKDLGVKVIPATYVTNVEGTMAATSDGESLGPFDAIVLSTGPAARPVPDGVTAIGDCLTPRSIWAAVSEGLEAARSL